MVVAAAVAVFLLVPGGGSGVAPVGAAEPPAASTERAPSTERVAGPTGTPIDAEVLPASKPSWLEVPAIGVRTDRIIELGLQADGALEVPGDAVTAGWFDQSPTPGEVGPAVVAGHVDYRKVPGVFQRLKELTSGAEVVVHRADGTSAVFAVSRVEHYAKSEFPTEKVYGDTSGPELRLITCGGEFDSSSGNYEDNVVAYARLVRAFRA
ncbi:class F sortase [Amycolatopsis antarctica]|uniref:Class F sortase n=1 Tax=Amycolatopsis antarctica TaxID=1854586 RepID=A0A263D7P9_9PSEU|nr:class F sortase [Amycolatopsis antarctica]